MLIDNLYTPILIDPILSRKANKLYIISGYASATFARRHLIELQKTKDEFEINLIIGMPSAKNDHMAFLLLHKEFSGKFNGYYLQGQPPVHCKAYSWYDNNTPFMGFTGSANYSQYGFFSDQQLNQLTADSPIEIKNLYENLLKKCIFIPDHKIELSQYHRIPRVDSVSPGEIEWEIPDIRVTISFLDKKGILPELSGLNWGQRLSKRTHPRTGVISWDRREPNQAYFSLKGDSRKEGFLPELAYTFSLITDDKHSFDCVVAQDGRKAIHSTNDNSELGRYIRNRIGVPLGTKITVEDLERYGRTDFSIEKIDDETFLFDFSTLREKTES
ncbi:MAG: NgoFVII family restriction endonuclease [Bacteroidetes bacterium]|nr:NgoFVII family restriction endonuclease [Bacteroidota bacterium]